VKLFLRKVKKEKKKKRKRKCFKLKELKVVIFRKSFKESVTEMDYNKLSKLMSLKH